MSGTDREEPDRGWKGIAIAMAIVVASGASGAFGIASATHQLRPETGFLFLVGILALAGTLPWQPAAARAVVARWIGLVVCNLGGFSALLFGAFVYAFAPMAIWNPLAGRPALEVVAEIVVTAGSAFVIACFFFAGSVLVAWPWRPRPAASPPAPPTDAQA
ncbi:MAG: hypothetical protein U1E56_01390 [Bauldia sp.]